jgi:acetyltransferase-like isoleucine patch superfamily enzyme
MKALAKLHLLARKAWSRLLMYVYRPLFAAHGKRFRFDPFGSYTFATIYVGDDVNLGSNAILMAAKSTIRIGNKVMFGPDAAVIAGVHNTSMVGRFMADVQQKRPQDDRDVITQAAQ